MQRIEEFQSAQNSKNGIIEKAILEELEKFGIVRIKYNSQTKIMMITDPERYNEMTS